MNAFKEQMKNGLILKNPIFVQLLGMCSALAISTSVSNALGMGAAVTLVLVCSNLIISLLRRIIPSEIRIAAYIVIISGFVSAVQLLIEAYLPAVNKSLGVFIPLIVVNCIILARAEAFASKNGPIASLFDGLFMGLGYTLALTVISAVRELLGSGSILGFKVLGDSYMPIRIFTHPAGAFLVLGFITAAVSALTSRAKNKKTKVKGEEND